MRLLRRGLGAAAVLVVALASFGLGRSLQRVPVPLPDPIRLPNRTIDTTERGISEELRDRLSRNEEQPIAVVLMLGQPPGSAERDALRKLGVRLDRALGPRAHFATLDGVDVSKIDNQLDWLELRKPEDTVSRALWEQIADPKVGAAPLAVLVQTQFGVTDEASHALLGPKARPFGPLHSWRVELTPDAIRSLAVSPNTVWIEQVYTGPTSPPKP
jgi:hypothetical protein